ncbi:hypothetical protein [Mycobacterium bourgelatii]|uniref:Uncharacterized protein n=1 Tax=Mycobacterium bourgelatii TaxID=1273442 RepID=A0A7I9YQS2_MYCBU|nr:hypothetical protein [Mycobacterium bourgelatii]MCV6975096.1 hypothetical protein [Mycobacterium bourgelatii]GFG91026.1 hypothetical protein MBOU_30680 [Mycobacterium bourgelatii]
MTPKPSTPHADQILGPYWESAVTPEALIQWSIELGKAAAELGFKSADGQVQAVQLLGYGHGALAEAISAAWTRYFVEMAAAGARFGEAATTVAAWAELLGTTLAAMSGVVDWAEAAIAALEAARVELELAGQNVEELIQTVIAEGHSQVAGISAGAVAAVSLPGWVSAAGGPPSLSPGGLQPGTAQGLTGASGPSTGAGMPGTTPVPPAGLTGALAPNPPATAVEQPLYEAPTGALAPASMPPPGDVAPVLSTTGPGGMPAPPGAPMPTAPAPPALPTGTAPIPSMAAPGGGVPAGPATGLPTTGLTPTAPATPAAPAAGLPATGAPATGLPAVGDGLPAASGLPAGTTPLGTPSAGTPATGMPPAAAVSPAAAVAGADAQAAAPAAAIGAVGPAAGAAPVAATAAGSVAGAPLTSAPLASASVAAATAAVPPAPAPVPAVPSVTPVAPTAPTIAPPPIAAAPPQSGVHVPASPSSSGAPPAAAAPNIPHPHPSTGPNTQGPAHVSPTASGNDQAPEEDDAAAVVPLLAPVDDSAVVVAPVLVRAAADEPSQLVDLDLATVRTVLEAAGGGSVVRWAAGMVVTGGRRQVVVTTDRGRGWLPSNVLLPEDAVLPWPHPDSTRWEGLRDPARVIVEYAAATGGTLTALASTHSSAPAVAAGVPFVFADAVQRPRPDLLGGSPARRERFGVEPARLVAAEAITDPDDQRRQAVWIAHDAAEKAGDRSVVRRSILAAWNADPTLSDPRKIERLGWDTLVVENETLWEQDFAARIDVRNVGIGQLDTGGGACRSVLLQSYATEAVLALRSASPRQALLEALYSWSMLLELIDTDREAVIA